MTLLLACAWGGLAAAPLAALARRARAVDRARALRRAPARWRAHPAAVLRARRAVALGRVVVSRSPIAGLVRARRARRDHDRLGRGLPVAVDLVAVTLAAGCTPWEAVRLGVRFAPPGVAAELRRVVHATSVGASLDEALAAAAGRRPAIEPLLTTLRTSARLGAPVTDALARLADEVRADARRRAEARARTVPVRLLFPLVCCVLPAFALLTVVPVVLDGLRF